MSRHRRGRFTVQRQPTGGERIMMRGMGVVHAVFGLVFVLVAVTEIIPSAGLFGLPFLVGGLFFAGNGIRLAVSKNDIAHRVGYDMETEIEEETILGPLEEAKPSSPAGETHDHIQSTAPGPQKRLEQLKDLKEAGLIDEREYKQKREEILKEL